jgi:hypothetical protein
MEVPYGSSPAASPSRSGDFCGQECWDRITGNRTDYARRQGFVKTARSNFIPRSPLSEGFSPLPDGNPLALRSDRSSGDIAGRASGS